VVHVDVTCSQVNEYCESRTFTRTALMTQQLNDCNMSGNSCESVVSDVFHVSRSDYVGPVTSKPCTPGGAVACGREIFTHAGVTYREVAGMQNKYSTLQCVSP
jgi:hypothetical protein